jgi:hypothetical protein
MPESNSPSNRASSARSDPIGSNRSPQFEIEHPAAAF